jgi:hypothetical protein
MVRPRTPTWDDLAVEEHHAGDAATATETLVESLEDNESSAPSGAERNLDRRFELIEALVMSVAAVLAAWAGFQAAKWSGAQDDAYSQAAALRVESTENATLASERSLADLDTLGQWLAALEREGRFDAPEVLTSDYRPDPTSLSGFWYLRFRPEFRTAVDAWIASEPLTNPDAAPGPFQMEEYRSEAKLEATRLSQAADLQLVDAREANQISDNYLLVTILLATVLFFAGISSKMDTLRARLLLLGMAIVLVAVSAGVLFSFPVEL